ncbi:Polysaccharide biosynthesis protein [compost metagenome]
MLTKNSLAMQSLMAFGIKIAAGVAGYILFALISRLTDTESFGQFSMIFSLATFLGIFGSYGQQIFILKNIAISRNDQDRQLEKGIYLFSISATLISSLASSLIFIFICIHFLDITNTTQIVSGTALCFMLAITQTTTGYYRINNKTLNAIVTRELLWRLLSITTITTIFLSINSKIDLSITVTIISLSLLLPTLLHVRSTRSWFRKLSIHKPKLKTKEWFETSTGLALISVISSADLYILTILLKNYASNTEIGAFFAASKTVELINMFLMAVTLIASPETSKLVAKRDTHELQRQCNSTLLLQGVPSAICCLVVIILSPWLLAIFDSNYMSYGSVLSLLCIGMIINSLTGSTVLLLQLGNMHWQHVAYQGGSLLIAILMLPLLTKYFGINGAALSFIISKSLWNILAVRAIRKKLHVDPSLIGVFSGGTASIKLAVKDVIFQIEQKTSKAK